MMHTSNEWSHPNLLAHAKKKAKKLLKLSQGNELTLNITSLSEAQDVIAKINGYENWHILEKVSKESENNPVTSKLIKSLSLFDEIQGFNKETENIWSINKHKNIYSFTEKNAIYSALSLDNMVFDNYGEFINSWESSEMAQILMTLVREFSVISLDLYYHNYDIQTQSIQLVPHIENNLVSDYMKQVYKDNVEALKPREENKKEFKLMGLITIKTDIRAKKEHHAFVSQIFSYLENIANVESIEDLSQYRKIIDWQRQKANQPMPVNNMSMIKLLKQVKNLENSEFNWSMSFTNDKNKQIVWGHYEENNKNTRFLLEGYKKELDKCMDSSYVKALDKQNIDFNFMTTSLRESIQSPGRNLVFARPGSGKSVLINYLNLKNMIGYGTLNWLGVIDVGSGSKAVVDMLKNNVCEEQKELIEYFKIQQTTQYCINIFDTQLGARYPSDEEMIGIKNFLLLLLSEEKTEETLNNLLEVIIQKIYKIHSDKNNPKRFDYGVEPQIDKIIEKESILTDIKTTWWEVVDKFFMLGYIEEAKIAQRHAVPLLSDVIYAFENKTIENVYNYMKVNTGEDVMEYVIEYIMRKLKDTLSMFNILSRPTTFSIDKYSVVVLDIDEVAKSGGRVAEHQTVVYYSLMQLILAKKFKISRWERGNFAYPSNIIAPDPVLAQKYQQYHHEQYKEYNNKLKIMAFDEYHRVSNSKIFNDIMVHHFKNQRSYNLDITIGSQQLLNEELNNLIDTTFILDSGYGNYEKEIKHLNIDTPKERRLLSKVSLKGHNLLIKQKNREASLLQFKMTNEMFWMFATTSEDVMIRSMLMMEYGYELAIRLLVIMYSSGIKKDVERRHENSDEKDRMKIIHQIRDEIIKKYKQF